MGKTMDRLIWMLLIVGVMIRLGLASISFHSDIAAFDFAGLILNQGNIFNLYDYLPNLPLSDPMRNFYPIYLFNYPPMVYFFFAGANFLSSIFTDPSFFNPFFSDIIKVMASWQLKLHLLLFKLPYLIFDLPIAFFLMKLFDQRHEKLMAFALWIFNPINIYATYLIGQFDIIPTFFVVSSLVWLFYRGQSFKNLLWSALLLGIGATFKIYPLFLLIPLASLVSSWRQRLEIIIVGILPYFLTILPFLPSAGFRSTALVANQTLKSLYPQILISGGESIMLFLASLLFIYLIFLNIRGNMESLWQRFFLPLLLFFIFTHYHPQWFLWLTPFLIISFIKSNFRNILPIGISLVSFFGLLFFFDPSLTLGLFSPLSPNLYKTQSLWQLLGMEIDYNFARSILQTIFVGAAVYFIYLYFPKNRGI